MSDNRENENLSAHLRIQLAAEVEKVNKLQEQLAAEREQRETEKDVSLAWTKQMSKKHQQLREELAAEREKVQELQRKLNGTDPHN